MSDLFANLKQAPAYPDAPGAKARETSFAAAEAIAPRVGNLRERVLAELQAFPGSPEQIAQRLSEPVMNIRPRCSELAHKGLIRDSGKRAFAQGGRRAIVWEIAP